MSAAFINPRRKTFHQKEIGAALLAARKRRGVTQAFAADFAGISNTYLCDLERGTSMPSLVVAAGLCKVYGISLDALAAQISIGGQS